MMRLSIGIITDSLLMLKAITKHGVDRISDLSVLSGLRSAQYNLIHNFLVGMQWIVINDETIVVSDKGNNILAHFDGVTLSQSLLRDILFAYVDLFHPVWAFRIPYGRKEAYIFMSTDEKRCFLEAGLLDTNPSIEVVEWWDKAAELIRGRCSLSLDALGRNGEQNSIRYEYKRTGYMPIWESIETNLAGYDILSKLSDTDLTPLRIEVKASDRPIDQARFLVSRHEWEVAEKCSSEKYVFHLWSFFKGCRLAIVHLNDLRTCIPIDKGSGKWQSVEIPFHLFGENFRVVNFFE